MILSHFVTYERKYYYYQIPRNCACSHIKVLVATCGDWRQVWATLVYSIYVYNFLLFICKICLLIRYVLFSGTQRIRQRLQHPRALLPHRRQRGQLAEHESFQDGTLRLQDRNCRCKKFTLSLSCKKTFPSSFDLFRSQFHQR